MQDLSSTHPQHAHLGVPVPVFHILECTFTTISMYILPVLLHTCKYIPPVCDLLEDTLVGRSMLKDKL